MFNHLIKCTLQNIYIDISADFLGDEHYDSKQICYIIFRNVTSLKTLYLNNLNFGKADEMKIRGRFSNLEVVCINNCSADPEILRSIVEQASDCLKEMTLVRTSCSFLNTIQSKMKSLIKIKIVKASGIGLCNLICNSPSLQSLEIMDCDLDEVCLVEVERAWVTMKKLRLEGCFGGGATFQNLLKNMPKLEKVELLSCQAPQPFEMSCCVPLVTTCHVTQCVNLTPQFEHQLSTVQVCKNQMCYISK